MFDAIILAQMCGGIEAGNANQLLDTLLNFEFVKAFTCTYGATTGFLVLGLLVYAPINLALWVKWGDPRVNITLTLLAGGAIIPQVAGPGVALVAMLVLIGGAGAITLLYYRYSR